jgi:predicted secreted protein
MKSKLSFILIALGIFMLCISSCKKSGNGMSNQQSVQVNEQENGKTIALSKTQTLTITLGNPGDGGYAFDTPKFDASVLSITNHTHIAPTSNATGDFGKDTWEFKALKSGGSTIIITATRSFDVNNPVTIFSGTIAVN